MRVPLDFLGAGAIVVAGSVVWRKVGIYPKRKDNWFVVANLWAGVVGRPSLLKSPALAEIMKPLNRLVSNAVEEHEQALSVYEVDAELAEARREAYKEGKKQRARKAGKSGDTSELTEWIQTEREIDAPEKPAIRRHKTEVATVEKLTELLLENPNGLLVHRDELAGWFRSLDKQGREGDRAFYNEGWNGTGSFEVDRTGRGSLHVPAVCLSILGGIQPGPLSACVYEATRGEQGDDGLLQRFQLLVWRDPPKSWRNVGEAPNRAAKTKAFEAFEKLDRQDVSHLERDEDVGIPALRFTPIAQTIFNEWREELEGRLLASNLSPALESHVAKFRSLLPSLALLFELLDSEGVPEAIDKTATLKAATWCVYLETHARRLYAAAEQPEMASARALLDRIRQGDVKHGSTVRDIYRRGLSKLATPAEVNGALEVLEHYGWLRVKTEGVGGQAKSLISLHPSLRGRGA
jgi:Protein of unknown function (DUF3987)